MLWKFKLGLFDDPYVDPVEAARVVGCDANRQLALLAARESLDRILVADPNVEAMPARLAKLPRVKFCDMLEAVRGADIIVVLQAHSAFKRISREDLMRRVVIDPTGLTEREKAS